MRERIWNNLLDIRFKAFYIDLLSSKFQKRDRYINIFLALASSGSIAAWTIWKEVPIVWGLIIALSQVIQVVKPYFPYMKISKYLDEVYIKLLGLHLDYERLWYTFDNEDITEKTATEKFFELNSKEHEIFKSSDGSISLEDDRIEKKTYLLMQTYVKNNYNIDYNPN